MTGVLIGRFLSYLGTGVSVHRQQFFMQFFPRDGHGFARLQVLHAPRYFFVPGSLHRFVRVFEAVEQSVSQSGALLNRESECSFQEISNFWTHGVILPWVVYLANVVYELVKERSVWARVSVFFILPNWYSSRNIYEDAVRSASK